MAKLKYPALLTGAREPQLGAPHPLPPFDLGRLGSSLAGTVTRKLIGPVMTVLRTLGPVWRFGGLAIVTREAEVRAVLGDPAHFEVPFGPEMTQLAGGTNFVLGLEGPGHDRQRRIIEAVVRRGDVARGRHHRGGGANLRGQAGPFGHGERVASRLQVERHGAAHDAEADETDLHGDDLLLPRTSLPACGEGRGGGRAPREAPAVRTATPALPREGGREKRVSRRTA